MRLICAFLNLIFCPRLCTKLHNLSSHSFQLLVKSLVIFRTKLNLYFSLDNAMTMTMTKTHTKTKTKTMTKTKCSKDPSHAIFLKSWEFKDIRYDAYNDKDNDNDNYKDKDKDKDKDKSAENLNICYIFEKLRIQGYQI